MLLSFNKILNVVYTDEMGFLEEMKMTDNTLYLFPHQLSHLLLHSLLHPLPHPLPQPAKQLQQLFCFKSHNYQICNKCLYAPREPNNPIAFKPWDDIDYSKVTSTLWLNLIIVFVFPLLIQAHLNFKGKYDGPGQILKKNIILTMEEMIQYNNGNKNET
ncbi:hypothetical protein U3516DRAFT_754014 [Neocallimastix sp. 'constans']